MRLSRALTSIGVGTTLALGVMTAPAHAAGPSACSSWKASSTFVYGSCGIVPAGTSWRLGIRCSDGDYDWSSWKSTTQRTSLRCNYAGATITHHWIDPLNN